MRSQRLSETRRAGLPIVAFSAATTLRRMNFLPRTVHVPRHAANPCKIVTFYEDFMAATRAYQIFDWLVQTFGGNLPVTTTSWSFSMLAMSRLTDAVLRASPSADVLVISASGDKDLPAHVALWMDRCITREPDSEPVLLALTAADWEEAEPATPFLASVEQIAIRRRARFMNGKSVAEHLKPRLAPEPPPREPHNPVRFDSKTTRAPVFWNRRWGIND
jgi:hypothetical protein